jgi:hypothetical protein
MNRIRPKFPQSAPERETVNLLAAQCYYALSAWPKPTVCDSIGRGFELRPTSEAIFQDWAAAMRGQEVIDDVFAVLPSGGVEPGHAGER